VVNDASRADRAIAGRRLGPLETSGSGGAESEEHELVTGHPGDDGFAAWMQRVDDRNELRRGKRSEPSIGTRQSEGRWAVMRVGRCTVTADEQCAEGWEERPTESGSV
jgi:hypothetical protein